MPNSRRGEAGNGHDLQIALLEIDNRDQVVDEWHFEGRPVTVHHQPILSQAGDHADHHPEPISIDGACLEADQILRPELAFLEDSPLFDKDLGVSQHLGAFPVLDSLESDLETLVDATNRPHLMGSALDPNRSAGIEMYDVLGLYVEAKEPTETVGTPEPADPVTGTLSRRTRRQP
jgi:hypothetical protein